jgi:hypothetical protein
MTSDLVRLGRAPVNARAGEPTSPERAPGRFAARPASAARSGVEVGSLRSIGASLPATRGLAIGWTAPVDGGALPVVDLTDRRRRAVCAARAIAPAGLGIAPGSERARAGDRHQPGGREAAPAGRRPIGARR